MFIINGIYMEYNITHTYGSKKFNYGTGYMIIQAGLVILIALLLKLYNKEKIIKPNLFNK